MNLNFNQIAMFQKFKSSMDRFRRNHPKFPLFVKAVSENALMEGTIIEITVTTPQGKSYSSNVKLKEDDIDLIKTLQQMEFPKGD
ncbi:MAG: hypothetical protein QM793_03800 [Muricomes sp.]